MDILENLNLAIQSISEDIDKGDLDAFNTAGSYVDAPGYLIAYRMLIGGRRSGYWIVNYNDQMVGTINIKGTKWKHEQINHTYNYPNKVMNKDNRRYLDSKMHDLGREIRKAISARNADIVKIKVDNEEINASEMNYTIPNYRGGAAFADPERRRPR